jgi:NAD(P)-dependent dehydrogenase (short-subunit alcohol dehydrogenase family)
VNRAKVVLVTHVGQGFGRAVALAYGQAGYDVVCADRDVDLATRTAAEIEELGGQSIPVQVDITSAFDVQAAFHKVWEIFGSLSGVVHVAGFESATAFHNLSESELTELLDETVRSSVLVLRSAQRSAPGSWVVLIAPAPHRDRPHIAAVGGALARLAATFPVPEPDPAVANDEAMQLPHVGLRVNVVVPSRPASDPRHDAPLVHAVRLLGGQAGTGVHGAEICVTLPAPPRVIETLLPEVQAALDDTVRQSEDGDVFSDTGAPDELAPGYGPPNGGSLGDAVAEEQLDDESLLRRNRALAAIMDQAGDEREARPLVATEAWLVSR